MQPSSHTKSEESFNSSVSLNSFSSEDYTYNGRKHSSVDTDTTSQSSPNNIPINKPYDPFLTQFQGPIIHSKIRKPETKFRRETFAASSFVSTPTSTYSTDSESYQEFELAAAKENHRRQQQSPATRKKNLKLSLIPEYKMDFVVGGKDKAKGVETNVVYRRKSNSLRPQRHSCIVERQKVGDLQRRYSLNELLLNSLQPDHSVFNVYWDFSNENIPRRK